MAIFLKLGKKASSFADPAAKVTISGDQVIEVTAAQAKSYLTNNAVKGGHLMRATRSEFNAWKKKADAIKAGKASLDKVESSDVKDLKKQITSLQTKVTELTDENTKLKLEIEELKKEDPTPVEELVDFDEMKSEELDAYYEENFEVTEEQVKAFKKLKVDKKREELEALETIDPEDEE